MNNKLLVDTVAAHFAGRVNFLLGDYVSIDECDYDSASDTCTVLTTAASTNVGESTLALEAKIKARTRVDSVSIYMMKKGPLKVVLRGCMAEYKRWTRAQLRLGNTERLLYLLLGFLACLACAAVYLHHR